MNEAIKIWLTELYKKEIEEVRGTISNERLWEKGYNGNEPYNPHTDNIQTLMEYLKILEEKLEDVK